MCLTRLSGSKAGERTRSEAMDNLYCMFKGPWRAVPV
jgi:hypothetical protein